MDELSVLKCLVVDDYESMRLILSADLRSLGVSKIDTAASGNEALEKIKKNLGTPTEYDIVFTDMNMPNGSGIDLARAIRADLKNKDLPILMISSIDEVSKMLDAVKAGISDYITKPWSKDLLKTKIKSCLAKRSKK